MNTSHKAINFLPILKISSLIFSIFLIQSCSNNSEDIPIGEVKLENEKIEKRGAGESCFDDAELDLSECLFWSENLNASFDEYPGCTFVIGVTYYRCFNSSSVNYSYFIEAVSLISHDCTAFDNDVLLAQQNGTLAEFSLHFDVMLFEAARDFLGASAPSSTLTVSITYITASCNQYCWITGSKNGFTYYTFFKNQCGVGCCTIESLYYYNNGNLISETNDVTSDGDLQSCSDNDACAAPGVVFSSRCIYSCDAYI